MSNMLAVLLVGCGNIAGGYDPGPGATAMPLTHAGAYIRHGGFTVTTCVEPDDTRREAFMRTWRIPMGYRTLEEVPAISHFDVVSICSPTAAHTQQVDAALALRPRLIFCEKPVTPQVHDTEACVTRCDAAGVLLAVNHTRRWAPDIISLRERLVAGELGTVRSVSGLYNKGVLNNGSHLIDLLHHLIGPLTVVAALAPIADALPDDPSVAALLQADAGGVPVHLRTAHASDYAVFELEIVTSTGILVMEEGGFAWRQRTVTDSASFPGYKTLGPADTSVGLYRNAMAAAVSNIHGALLNHDPLRSTGATALAAQRVCHQLLHLARQTT
nr:Gfo/Idh/MocA family oxidoreductase [Acidovorax delafieldii]